jgi:hypothetical protein
MSDYSTFQWGLDKARQIEQEQGPGAAQNWVGQLGFRDAVRDALMQELLGESFNPADLSTEDTVEHKAPQGPPQNFLPEVEPHAVGDAAHGLNEGLLDPTEYGGILDDWNQGLIDKSQGRDLRDLKETPKEDVTGPNMQWQPGQKGRGILVGDPTGNRYLHTWPVNITPEDPFGGKMHGEYLRQYEHDPNVTSRGFEIEPDGTMVNGDPSLVPEVQQFDPNIKNPEEEWGNFLPN